MLIQPVKQPYYYPLNPVVTNSSILRAQYNEHFDSFCLLSECLTSDELQALWLKEPKLKMIVFVNGEGKEFMNKMGDIGHWDEEVKPTIKEINLVDHQSEQWIIQLHDIIRQGTSNCGIGGG